MPDSNEKLTWGFHLNETIYSLACPPCPKWASFREQQKWSEIGVVVWDALICRVNHLHGSQAVHILLDHVQQSDTWEKEGLLVGEVAYCVTIPSNKKSKKRSEYQPEMKPSQEDGWCLTNTIPLLPDQTQQFLSFLEQQKTRLEKVIKTEEAERKRVLGQVYSLILGWGEQQKQNSASVKTQVVQETKPVLSGAIPISHGNYHTIAQVAKICGVGEKTVSMWFTKGILKGLNLPGLGQIIEEKDLEKYLAEK